MEKEVKRVSVAAFEAAVFQIEHIEIRIRASITEEVDDYDFSRKAHDGTTVSDWLDNRVRQKIDPFEVSIIDGNLQHPHGLTKLGKVRASYVSK